jgi:predicted oxidoreductase
MNQSQASNTYRSRSIGALPLQVGPIAYGFWRFAGTSTKKAREKVELALELGMNLLDHADIYGVDGGGSFGDAESLFGEVLKEAPQLRDKMLIATKGGIVLGRPYDSSEEYLITAVDRSLKRLNIEQIDLYQIHRPDFLTHPVELAQTLEKLKTSGKVREFGVSNYTVSQTRALQAHLNFPLATTQPEWSCLAHDPLRDGTLDLCMETGMVPLGWSPLGGGKLAWHDERINQAMNEGQLTTKSADILKGLITILDQLSEVYEVSRTAIAIAWSMSHPAGVIPIIGTQNLDRMRDCIDAQKIILSREEWNRVLVGAQGYPLP